MEIAVVQQKPITTISLNEDLDVWNLASVLDVAITNAQSDLKLIDYAKRMLIALSNAHPELNNPSALRPYRVS